jgi:allantoinase
MVLDLVIKNGKVVTSINVRKSSIGIKKGKIVWLGENGFSPSAEQTIDAKGKHVIPGCIDVHVHFREPLRPDKEDWSTGSKSAICGGVTTVLDMPESVEPTVEGLNKKLDSALSKSVVDFGLYGRPTTPENVEALSKAGVIAYKILLGYEQFVPDDGTFFRLLKAIGKTYLPVAVHAEDINIVKSLRDHLLKEGKKDIEAHELSRPTFIEEEAIAKTLILARVAECRLHIAHVSTAEGAGLIGQARAASAQEVTAETCPHYLMLDKSDLERLGPYGKINPPVRGTRKNMEGLWTALSRGVIDCIATDHAPHLITEKEVGWENIFEAAPGAIGVQTMLPLMLTSVNEGKLSLCKMVELMAFNPAKIFDLYPRKGIIQLGSEADLVIVDMERKVTIRAEDQHSKMPFTPYDGWDVQGIPEITILRGEVAARDGEPTVTPGYGEWLRPMAATDSSKAR